MVSSLLLLLALQAPTAAASAPQSVAIRADRMFDAESGRMVSPGLVVVAGKHIAQVGGSPPPGARLIELDDATLLPGLIDSHTHISDWRAGDWHDKFLMGDAARALVAAKNARVTLQAGFTTVRDLWSYGPHRRRHPRRGCTQGRARPADHRCCHSTRCARRALRADLVGG